MKKLTSALLFPIIILSSFGCAKKPFLSNVKNPVDAYQECQKLSDNKNYDEAAQCFELLKSRFGGSREAREADLSIADSYFRKKEFLLAAESYLAFSKLHPTDEKIGYAFFRAGLSYLRQSPKAIDRDQQYLDDAIHYLELALTQGGEFKDVAREKWREARTRVARRHFYIGKFYYKTGEYQSAAPRFQTIVTSYTDLGLDEESLYLLGMSYVKMSENDKARDILSVFEQHFPQSSYRKKLTAKLK